MTVSILVISAAPDDRLSTGALRSTVRALGADPRVRVTVWFLRGGTEAHRWPEARVVDSLRTSAVAEFLRRARLAPLAGVIGGLRLRRWWRRVAPDVVVLDDGLGGRVLRRPNCPVIVRTNAVAPHDDDLEATWTGPTFAAIVGPGAMDRGHPRRLVEPEQGAEGGDVASVSPSRLRSLFRLPDDGDLIGWIADDALNDAGRALDVLERLHSGGISPHLVWLRPGRTQTEVDRLRAEAEVRGLGAHVHPRPETTTAFLSVCEVVVTADATAVPVAALGTAGTSVIGPAQRPVAGMIGADLADAADLASAIAAQLDLARSGRTAAAALVTDTSRFQRELGDLLIAASVA